MSDLIRVEAVLRPLPGLALNNGQKTALGVSAASDSADSDRAGDGRSLGSKPFLAPARVRMPVDPDKPTGPPPTFDTNLLEAETEKLSNPDQRESGDMSATFAAPSGLAKPNHVLDIHDKFARAAAETQQHGLPIVDILR